MNKKRLIKNLKARLGAAQEMRKHYKEMSEAGTGELHFERTQVQCLKSLLDEIAEYTDDTIIKAMVENGTNKFQINKLAHARKLFR